VVAVTFSTDTNDSGGGVDGTIHNNAWKQAMATAINAAFTDWDDYTPTWGNTGTANTLGNGTLAGRYHTVNKRVFFQIEFVWGTTTASGNAAWTFTLPVTAVAATNPEQTIGGATITDVSVGNYCGIVQQFTTTTCVVYNTNAITNGVGFSGSVPMTWVSTDKMSICGSYQIP